MSPLAGGVLMGGGVPQTPFQQEGRFTPQGGGRCERGGVREGGSGLREGRAGDYNHLTAARAGGPEVCVAHHRPLRPDSGQAPESHSSFAKKNICFRFLFFFHFFLKRSLYSAVNHSSPIGILCASGTKMHLTKSILWQWFYLLDVLME